MVLLKGTHDSGAYKFTDFLGNICFIKAQAKTQTLSIKQQVEAGYRLFDLRIRARKNKYYLAHTFYCGELEEELSHLSDINNVWIDVKADLRHDNLTDKQKYEIRYIFDKLVPNATISCNRTTLKGAFPNIFDEISGLSENPDDLLSQIEKRLDSIDRQAYVCFVASSNLNTVIRRTLKGHSLLDIARVTNKYLSELEKMISGKNHIIGYTVDGAL